MTTSETTDDKINKSALIKLLESHLIDSEKKNNKAYYRGYNDGISDCILLINNPQQK